MNFHSYSNIRKQKGTPMRRYKSGYYSLAAALKKQSRVPVMDRRVGRENFHFPLGGLLGQIFV